MTINTENLYGYLSVIGANIFFGSFGVPIKSESITRLNVDPVVFQTYKTIAVFVTSWLILTYNEFYFTWWGFVGASMWVPNGCLTVIIIRYVGLGTGQGIWSGLTVWVSFIWGATALNEEVNSLPLSLLALLTLVAGIVGVAFISDVKKNKPEPTEKGNDVKDNEKDEYKVIEINKSEKDEIIIPVHPGVDNTSRRKFVIGIILAVYVGFSNGSLLVPLSYAPPESQGINYTISFAIGALCFNAVLLVGYFIFCYFVYRQVPAFHVKNAAIPALCSGLFWAIGNFCSIYATLYLGQTIGYPLVQCSLLIAGLWGIFYFKEIQGKLRITGFFVCTIVVLISVFMLSKAG